MVENTKVEDALARDGSMLEGPDEHVQVEAEVDTFTGQVALSIPLRVTTARSLTPALSLDYASDNKQGVFGAGFKLSLSAIVRRASEGAPRYDDTDIFLFDGQVLVPDAAGAQRRSLVTDGSTQTYDVLRFRPRLDAGRERIERWTPCGSGRGQFWRVLGADGTTRYFGLGPACCVSHPQDGARMFAWLEELAIDARGEALSFTYAPEDAANPTAAAYPARIRYGNRQPLAAGEAGIPVLGGVEWHYEIVFDYGEYDFSEANRHPYTPVRAWPPARPDPFSCADGGFALSIRRLCRNIAVFHRFEEVWGGEPVLVGTTSLRYDEHPAGSVLAGLRYTGWRYRPGRSYRAKSLPELAFGYVPRAPGAPGQPRLLAEIADPCGCKTLIRYADLESVRQAGPVVTQVERLDLVSDTCHLASYAYHDGHYDSRERAFRGFGLVERKEELSRREDGTAIAAPILLREWFDTGAPEQPSGAVRGCFALDPQAFPQLHTRYELGPAEGGGEALRQAQLAAAGARMRAELYALGQNGGERVPVTVRQWGITVTLLQEPAADPSCAPHGVYARCEREEVESEYEGIAHDPRVTHRLAMAPDEHGIARACTIHYARRPCAERVPEQAKTYVFAETTTSLAVLDLPDIYLAGLVYDQRRYQLDLDRLLPAGAGATFLGFDDLTGALAGALAGICAGAHATGAGLTLLSWQRSYYQGEGGETPSCAPLPQALLLRRETAVFADAAVEELFAEVPVPGGLSELLSEQGGYRFDRESGFWWAAGDSVVYGGADQFFRPLERRDAFAAKTEGREGTRSGTITRFEYDPSWLLVTRTLRSSRAGDVLPQETRVEAIDHAGPRPRRITASGVTTEAAIDPLGRIVALSYHGTEWSEQGGVRAGFAAMGDIEWYDWPEPAGLAALAADPASFIRGAARYFYADDHGFAMGRGAVGTATLQAAAYPEEAAPAAPSGDLRMTVRYQDAAGRAVRTLSLAEPGEVGPRWRCAGRFRRDAEGRVFEAGKAYFADSCLYLRQPTAFYGVGEPETFSYDARGRLVRAARPAGGLRDALFTRRELGPWTDTAFDENDTIKDSLYYRMATSGALALPRWARDALDKAAAFDGTPSTHVFDTLRHPVCSLARLAPGHAAVLATQRGFSADGLPLWLADPRLSRSGLVNSRMSRSMTGAVLKTVDADAGTLYTLPDVNGAVCYSYDARGTAVLPVFDSLHRVTRLTVRPGAGARQGGTRTGWLVVERSIYGDSLDAHGKPPVDHARERGLLGRPYLAYDGAGRTMTPARSLLGMPLSTEVRMREYYKDTADWSSTAAGWPDILADLDHQLAADDLAGAGTSGLRSACEYNALGQVLKLTDPAGHVQRCSYNAAGLLDGSWFAARGEAERQVVADLAYDAEGRQTAAAYVNAEGERFLQLSRTYEPDSGRLHRILSVRAADGQAVQDCVYWYDPAGNLTHIENKAAAALPLSLPTGLTPDQDYTYDALYRLTLACGLARQGLSLAHAQAGGFEPFIPAGPVASCVLRNTFDDGDNLTASLFSAGDDIWGDRLTVSPLSNRAVRLAPGESPLAAEGWFDVNGNQLKLPDGGAIAWNWHNQIASLIAGAAGEEQAVTEHYVYGACGARRRKVIDGWTEDGEPLVEHEFEVGCFQVRCVERDGRLSVVRQRTRMRQGGHLAFERLDGLDGAGERYQLSNMQGSAVMEVDGQGALITYEEYAPCGTTLFAFGRSVAEARLKRHRFAGQERDQASGLYHYDDGGDGKLGGARYLAPWPGRWLSPGPSGAGGGPNRYAYLAGVASGLPFSTT
jgi:RHS repeat-associated protein